MEVELALDCAPGIDSPLAAARLTGAAEAALIAAGIADGEECVEIALRLVGETDSAELNGRFRNRPYPTNVLSFPADARLPGLRVLGDLVVCLPVVAREAQAQRKTIEAHLMHLVVHGSLHLLGFDHIGDDEAEAMEAIERRAMAALGCGDPYRLDSTD